MALINGMNMIDGVDGLAGSSALVSLSALAVCAALIGRSEELRIALLFAGAVLGFLAFNLRAPWRARARVFMGDAGSTALGFAIAWLCVALANPAFNAVPAMVMPWLIALPILDLVTTMARRARDSRKLMAPGRDHLHHLLADRGWSPARIAVTLAGGSAACAAAGIGAWRAGAPAWLLFYGYLALLAGHFMLTRRLRHGARSETGR
jgi:UDP-GlcNAc:undecaprenyl-phosphate GlcNAc-1-phosphate transferase